MRDRTAKILGRRHDPNYVEHLSLYRCLRHLLGWGLPIAAALVLLVTAVLPFRITAIVYSPGPLSPAHAFIADRCDRCHTQMAQGKRKWTLVRKASDDACLSCHQAPTHHFGGKQPAPPTCASCHTEHQGAALLVHVKDRQCLNCHSNLKKHFDETKFLNVSGFNGSDHPQFNALRGRGHDFPTIIFPHGLHMGDTMRTIEGKKLNPGELACDNCHRPLARNDGRKWQYGQEAISIVENKDRNQHRHPDAGREHMNMPSYEKHCAKCHALEFALKFDTIKVPHPKQTNEVHNFLVTSYTTYIHQHREELHPVQERKIPPSALSEPPAMPRNEEEWVTQKVAQAEAFLWSKSCVGRDAKRPCLQLNTCGDCHVLNNLPSRTAQGTTLPVVADSHYRFNQMGNAVFSHESHSAFTCESCHVYKKHCCAEILPNTSEEGPDVLLPGIATCQSCHNGSPPTTGKAENGCFLCHQYHKWNQRDTLQPGGFRANQTVEDLNGSKPPEFHTPAEKSPGN